MSIFLKTPAKEIIEVVEIVGCRVNFLVYDKNGTPDCGCIQSMHVDGFVGYKVIPAPKWSHP
jgi:hypothetical protein